MHVESHLENLGFSRFKNRKSYFFKRLRHALSDLGIDFDILRDKHNLQPNRPFLHYKFPCSLRALGMTQSIRMGPSGSKCTSVYGLQRVSLLLNIDSFLHFPL